MKNSEEVQSIGAVNEGAPSSIFRIVYTNSRIGYRVERWNRFASKWQHAGFERALDRVRSLVRFRLAVLVETVDLRNAVSR